MRIDILSAAPPLVAHPAAGHVQQHMARQTESSEESLPVVASAAVSSRRSAPVEKAKSEDGDPYLSPEELDKLVSHGNSLFEELHLNEQFRLVRHDKLPRTIIRLIDVKQDRIIREFPPQKYLDLVAALQELSGLLLDEKV